MKGASHGWECTRKTGRRSSDQETLSAFLMGQIVNLEEYIYHWLEVRDYFLIPPAFADLCDARDIMAHYTQNLTTSILPISLVDCTLEQALWISRRVGIRV
jgi:hypothetical protein